MRVSPLEDTIVALRPIMPKLPFAVPNSIRPLNPMMPLGSTDRASTASTRTATPTTSDHHQRARELRLGVRLALPHPQPRGDGHDAAGVGGRASLGADKPAGQLQRQRRRAELDQHRCECHGVQRAARYGQRLYREPADLPVGDANSYTDSSASAGSTYYYRVYATNTVGSTKDSGFTQSPGGNSMPTMKVASGYSNTATVLAGNPVIGVAPAALNFGNVLLNTSAGPQSITLSNTGGVALAINSIGLGGANAAQFAMPASANPCGVTLNSGASCVISVTFSPTTLGAQSAVINIATNDPSSPLFTVPLTGSGIANTSLALSAPAIAFGQNGLITLSMSSTQVNPVSGNVTLTVDGGAPLSQALVNGSTTFTLTAPSAGTHTLAANYAAQGGVSAASATGSLVVSTAALTITASGASMSYGGPVPAITPGYSGFVLGQGPANLTGTVTCTTTATSTSPVSGNPYSGSCSGATSTNYAIQYVASTVTVNPAATTTTIMSNLPNPSIPGQIVTISFKVAPQFSGVPTGSVKVLASSGESCSVVLPAASCTLSFASSGARTLTATYSGDGNFAGSISPAANQQVVSGVVLSTTSLLFGNQLVGSTSASQAVTIANVGTTTLSISGFSFGGLNPADFTQTTNCGKTLRAGQNCRVNVSFRPAAAGTRTATLIISDSDVSSPQTVSLTGMGVQPAAALTPASYNFGTVLRRQTLLTDSRCRTPERSRLPSTGSA